MSKSKFSENVSANTQFHRAGRWLNEPKEEHLIVLQALEIANKAFARVVAVNEVILALSSKEINILNNKYNSSLTLIVSKILHLLCKRGKIFKTDKVGKVRYYGILGLLSLENVTLDDFQSLRSRILKFTEAAVVKRKRALQLGEITEFIQSLKISPAIPPKLISQTVMSLKQTGELIKIPIRGNEKGFGVYLPSHFDPSEYLVEQPLTWLEFVLSIFNEIWSNHKLTAQKFNSKPFPVSTEEIRKRIIESKKFIHKLRDTRILVSTMIQLSRTANPSLRKLQRPNQKSLYWLPLNTPDSEVNTGDFYLRDTDRIQEAVKRASFRYDRPVKLSEIKEEVEFDSYLKPVSDVAYHKLLSDLAKERTYKKKDKPKSINKKICRVGKLQGSSYYYFENNPGAIAFIEFKLLEQKLNDLNPTEDLTKIESCILPTVAFGRVKLIRTEIESILKNLKNIRSIGKIIGVSETEVDKLTKSILKTKSQVQKWMKKQETLFSCLPNENKFKIKGWTKHRLKEVLTPLYHRISTIKSDNYFQSLIGNIIKRIPNPNFKRINSKIPQFAAEYLYDESDALMYIAKEWGGVESRYHANIAYSELGSLRDPIFIIPALDSEDFNQRLCAVSCLAFLPCEQAANKLRFFATNDADTGVRQSSLWAYGFVVGEEAIQFIRERATKDTDSRVRNFARNLIENSTDVWFKFRK